MQSSNSPKYLIGSLIVIAILFLIAKLILSNMLAVADGVLEPEPMDAAAIEERIKPVAQENIGEEQIAAAPAPAAAEEDAAADDAAGAEENSVGKQVYNQVCSVCHSTGMMNSPRFGNADDWAPRLEQGMETVYAHALNGLNMMPARGGNPTLSDDEVKAAVDFMISSAD